MEPDRPSELVAHDRSQASESLVGYLLDHSIIPIDDWDRLAPETRKELMTCAVRPRLVEQLLEHQLLTEYQAKYINANREAKLILGNYRILDQLGSGGMGSVYKAEHRLLRRPVAIKLILLSADESPDKLQRFYIEMRALAQLRHPNIISAIDAGEVANPDPNWPRLHYYVMEYVAGQDLEKYVEARGALSPARACDLMHQVAWALLETHKRDLIHRDIKPSNVLITPEGQAKLVDFGLVRHFQHRRTEPGAVMGTPLYMAPEQALDSSAVDLRADIYGLGATLFWCLTAKDPFPAERNIAAIIKRRLTQPPPSAMALRPDIPPELDAVVKKMMALKPEDRYPTAQAVMAALHPFLGSSSFKQSLAPEHLGAGPRIMIVDDDPGIRDFCRLVLQAEGMECDVASDGTDALARIAKRHYDLVVSDWEMPGMSGAELCRRLREEPPWPNLKVILFSGTVSGDDLARMLSSGADDYLLKPFQATEFTGRVKSVLRTKSLQDRAESGRRQLLEALHREGTQQVGGDLNRLTTAWPKLSDDVRRALLAVIESLGSTET